MDKTTRLYKDKFFRALFNSDNKRLLELFNAVTDDDIPDDTDVKPFPSNSLFERYNDLAFSVGSQLIVFCEHSSTIAPNMPIRLLSYVTDILYSHLVSMDKLYGSVIVRIPTPKFFILYNGEQRLENQTLKLSDAFIVKDLEPALELTARVIDINYDSNAPALRRSESLSGYSFLVSEIRKNLRNGMTRDKSIITAIDLCIENNVLAEFLREHYQEAIKMLNYEYDAEAERRVIRQETWQEAMDTLAELLKKGFPLEIALEKAKELAKEN